MGGFPGTHEALAGEGEPHGDSIQGPSGALNCLWHWICGMEIPCCSDLMGLPWIGTSQGSLYNDIMGLHCVGTLWGSLCKDLIGLPLQGPDRTSLGRDPGQLPHRAPLCREFTLLIDTWLWSPNTFYDVVESSEWLPGRLGHPCQVDQCHTGI